eukprot:15432859-Alexandrium_andersonii.AAC.1
MLTNTRTCVARTYAATPNSTRVKVESETNEARNLAHSDARKIAISPTRECKRGVECGCECLRAVSENNHPACERTLARRCSTCAPSHLDVFQPTLQPNTHAATAAFTHVVSNMRGGK